MKAVYSSSRYTVNNILEAIKRGNIRYYTNMPRNVFRAQQIAGPEPEPTVSLGNRNKIGLGVSFLSDVAPRYPNCSFVTTTFNMYSFDSGDIVDLKGIYVFAGDEPLGFIEFADKKLAFYNDRISADVKRGDRKITSKLNTAKAIFAKYFYGMTPLEHMKAIAVDVAYEVDNAIHSMRHDCTKAEHKLLSFLRKEVEQNNQLVMTCIETLGEASLIDSYRATKEAATAAGVLGKLINDQKGHYVMLKDDEYISWRKGNSDVLDQPKRHKREEMPENMRMALGLLKLAEVNTFVHEAGFKAAENKFFILDEVQIEFDN